MSDELTFSDLAAEEIRSMLGRKRVSGSELARRLGVSHTWVSYRLTGSQEIGLNDIYRIAEALDVDVYDLLPARERQPATYAPPRRDRHDRRGTGRKSNGGSLQRADRPRPTVQVDKAAQSKARYGEAMTTVGVGRPVRLSTPAADSAA
jgi:transcriptional regulator with XRE-family HTH domain